MVWESMISNPLKGSVVWPVPENKEAVITLFKDPRSNEFEDKDWTFSIEDVTCFLLHIDPFIYFVIYINVLYLLLIFSYSRFPHLVNADK